MNDSHNYNTRSKSKNNNPPDEIDEHGNSTGLIDYNCNEEFNKDELYTELFKLSKGRISMLEIEKSTPRSTKKTNKISVEEISNTSSPKKSKTNKPKQVIKKSSS